MHGRISRFIQVDVPANSTSHDQQRLANLDSMLHGLGVTIWQTDIELRLVESYGMVIADSFHGRTIGDFYREVYEVSGADGEPMRNADRDARDGLSITMHVEHRGERFVMLIEPRRDSEGQIIGTIGMSLRVD